ELISQWQVVFDKTYQEPGPQQDPMFNISGWNSSYTGLPIPEAEMREWLDHTVDRLRTLCPRRILEIGCGTGLLLFRLAPSCTSYWGTDFSKVAVESLQEKLATL